MTNKLDREQIDMSEGSPVCLAVLCGLPGSGKSSLAKRILDHVRSCTSDTCLDKCSPKHFCVMEDESRICRRSPQDGNDPNFSEFKSWEAVLISYDALLPREHEEKLVLHAKDHSGGYTEDFPGWKEYRKDIMRCVECTVSMLLTGPAPSDQHLQSLTCTNQDLRKAYKECVWNNCLKNWECSKRYLFVIDDNMYYQSMRYEYYQLARKYQTGYMQIYIPCSLNLARRRNFERESPVPDDVVVIMATKLEIPDKLTTWQKNTLVWDNRSDISDICNMALAACCNPMRGPVEADVQEKLQSRVFCSRSTIHQTDQILRKLVKQYIATFYGSSESELKQAAKLSNECRAIILDQLRNQILLIPEHLELCSENASQDCDNAMYKYISDQFHKLL